MIIFPGIQRGHMEEDESGQFSIKNFTQPAPLRFGKVQRGAVCKNKTVTAVIEMIIYRPQQAAVMIETALPDVMVTRNSIVGAFQRLHRLLEGRILRLAARGHQIAQADQKVDAGSIDLFDDLRQHLIMTLTVPHQSEERPVGKTFFNRGKQQPLPAAALHRKGKAGRRRKNHGGVGPLLPPLRDNLHCGGGSHILHHDLHRGAPFFLPFEEKLHIRAVGPQPYLLIQRRDLESPLSSDRHRRSSGGAGRQPCA